MNPTNNTYVNLTVKHNYPPKNITPFIETFATTIPWPANYSLNASIFVDAEGDQVLLSCPTITTTATANDVTFISYVYNYVFGSLTNTLVFNG